jgi:hypothetical protein
MVLTALEVALDALDVAHEVGPTMTTRAWASAMIWAISGGARRQFTGDVDRVELGEAERDVEELQAVLVDEGHAVAGPDARGPQSLGHPRRALVELTEGDRAPGDLERRERPAAGPRGPGRRAASVRYGREISGAGSVGSGHEVVPPKSGPGPR